MNSQPLELVQVCEDAAYWSWRPSDRGRPLASFRESVARHRQLVQEAPAEHEEGLATALLGLSICLAGLGRALEALAAAHEAALIGRQLTAADTGHCQQVLAFALFNLGLRLRDMGQDERSLAAGEEAVEQCRRLTDENFPAREQVLAAALSGLCAHYSKEGHRDRALAAAQEAADAYRRLAAASPAIADPDQAGSLNNIGAALASLRGPSAAVPPLWAAADIYQRLIEAAPGTCERDYAITLDNLTAAMADRHDWVAIIGVTERAIQVQRLLAAEAPRFELTLGRSLTELALAHDRTENPAEAALAAGAEAIGIYQRLAAASPEAIAPLLRHASQVLDGLLLTRDRLLLPPERSRFHFEADSNIAIIDAQARLAGVPPPPGLPLAGAIVTGIQHSLGRIGAAAAVARSFLTAPGDYLRRTIPDDALGRARDDARRCLELYLSTRRTAGICRRHLGYAFPDPAASPADRESPPAASETIEQVGRSAEDAEKASALLASQLAGVIAADDGLFAECMPDLLERLPPEDSEGWRLISVIMRQREPYRWIFADERIEADVAALAFLEQLGPGATGTAEPADIDIEHWISAALQNIYEKTALS